MTVMQSDSDSILRLTDKHITKCFEAVDLTSLRRSTRLIDLIYCSHLPKSTSKFYPVLVFEPVHGANVRQADVAHIVERALDSILTVALAYITDISKLRIHIVNIIESDFPTRLNGASRLKLPQKTI